MAEYLKTFDKTLVMFDIKENAFMGFTSFSSLVLFPD
jgi:hypothetical protein